MLTQGGVVAGSLLIEKKELPVKFYLFNAKQNSFGL